MTRQANDPRRRYALVEFIGRFQAEHGYSPSIREMCDGVNLKSPGTVYHHLQSLAAQGLIEWKPGRYRAVMVAERGPTLSDLLQAIGAPSVAEAIDRVRQWQGASA